MSQQELYTFLKENEGNWYCASDLSDLCNITRHNVTTNLVKLRKSYKNIKSDSRGNKKYYAYYE